MPEVSRRRRAKVVTLVDRLTSAGGAERLALETTRRLDQKRFEPILCASRRTSGEEAARLQAELEAEGVRVLRLDRSSTADILAWRALAALLRRERVDVLHAHKFGSNLWGTSLGRMARVPVVIAHEHTWSFRGKPVRRLLDRHLIGRWADAFIAVSREDRRRMIALEGIAAERVIVIPNGIGPRRGGRTGLRAEIGAGAEDPVVGAVAVLRPQKALHVLIEASSILARDHPRLRVVIAGEGEERERLESLIRELGLGETVVLLGHRSDIPDLLTAVDVTVSCSDFEGSPLAVMEYMAAGKPVAATAVGGIPDLIEDGVHGLLVPRSDPAALAGAIDRLLRDPDEAHRMGERARTRQRKEFDLDAMVRRVERLYDELLADKRAGP